MSTSTADVVVTGMGATTPLGGDVATTWEALLAGRSGVSRLTDDWAKKFPAQLVARLAVDPAQQIDRVRARRLDRSQQVAVIAAEEAWKESGVGDTGVAKVVSTSSSAIFGIPERNPVTEDTPPRPLEAYGRAKAEAEALCREAVAGGLDVTIVRPRTILGHGRLGIMAILFEFVAEGAPLYLARQACVDSGIITESLRLDQPPVTLVGGPATLAPSVAEYAICG